MANDNPTDQSGKRYFGIGIVAVDKPRGSDFIMVTPIEKIAMRSGRLKEAEHKIEVSSQNVSGTVTSDTVTAQSMLKAKWLVGDDGNRQTAPDVQEGETVDLYRYGNSNEYYWTTTYREPGLRRLETVLYCYGNLSSKGAVWTKDSSWWYEISTHDKHIRWQTTQSDGEAYAYNFHISAKDSFITIEDNIQNQWFMDSKEHLMRARNADGSFVDLDKLRYHGFAQEHMTHESDITHMKTPLFTVCAGDEGGYHSGPFVQVSQGGNHAQIGSGDSAYAHFTGPDINVKSDSSITEETQTKTVKNSTSTTESGTVTETYGTLTRTAISISEDAGVVSRSASASADSVGERSLKADTSKETHGQKQETIGVNEQTIDSQKSDIKSQEVTSQEQTNTSQSRQEEYGSLKTKIESKEEEIGSLSQIVKGKSSQEVGEFSLTSAGDITLMSGGTVVTSDAEISNLKVPGVITLEGKNLNEQVATLFEITTDHTGRIETIEDTLGIHADTMEQQSASITENKEATEAVKGDLDKTTQEAQALKSELATAKEETVKLEDKVRALEEWKKEAIDLFAQIDKRIQDNEQKIQEAAAAASEAAQAAQQAQSSADTAAEVANAANDAASSAGDIASQAASDAAAASSLATSAADAAAAAADAAAAAQTPVDPPADPVV